MARKLARAPRFITGYHGCSNETADRLLSGDAWLASENRYDWLGIGIYFWEYGPFRAGEWAVARFGSAGAVLEGRIRLGRCLNLLDTEHFGRMRSVLLAARQTAGRLPTNLPDGRHYLDRLLIEDYVRLLEEASDQTVQSVRGCFPEGEPVYPGSRILARAHVQVAVRDPHCVLNLRRVELNTIRE